MRPARPGRQLLIPRGPAGVRGASSPARRLCFPAVGAGPRSLAPARIACSSGRTASAPHGTCAPVELSTDSPAASPPGAWTAPARTAPADSRHRPGPARRSRPSPPVSKGGKGCTVRRSSASVSPAVRASGVRWTGKGTGTGAACAGSRARDHGRATQEEVTGAAASTVMCPRCRRRLTPCGTGGCRRAPGRSRLPRWGGGASAAHDEPCRPWNSGRVRCEPYRSSQAREARSAASSVIARSSTPGSRKVHADSARRTAGSR